MKEVLTDKELLFLPPNSAGIMQTLDLGMIGFLKCKIRRFQTYYIHHALENDNFATSDAYKRLSLKDAIFFSSRAWMN